MDDTEETEEGGSEPTWASLFERATAYGIEESAVREALSRRREGEKEGGG